MIIENLKDFDISTLSIIGYDDIPLLGTVTINNDLWGRPDLIINRWYNGVMEFLPIFLDYNKIPDITEIQLGQILELPDIEFIINEMIINKIHETDVVPGISPLGYVKPPNVKAGTNSTQALPKLKITLPTVKYDSQSGIIKF